MWCQLDSVTLLSLGGVGGALLENAKEKVTIRLPFKVSGILRLPLLIKQEKENMLPSSDFCGINEVVNKSIFIRNDFIFTLLSQRKKHSLLN